MNNLQTFRLLACVVFVLAGFLAGCSSLPYVTPLVQRVVILADTATIYEINGERRLYKTVGTALRGDTLFSYAQVVLQADSLERYFYVVHRGAQGWIYQGSGQSSGQNSGQGSGQSAGQSSARGAYASGRIAAGEYELAVKVCDTKFTLPREADEQAWERALDYVKRHSVRPLQSISDVMIENSLRGGRNSERDIVFVVKRTLLADGVAYTVKADESFSSVNAKKCAFFIQTGKDERDFHGIETVESLSKLTQKPR